MTLDKLFSPKQQQVLKQELCNKQWDLMINYGAIRAGKTFVDNFVFLIEVKHAAEVSKADKIKYPMYILAGVSSKSISNNILTEIANTFGLTFKMDQHHSFKIRFPGLPAVKIVQTFTGSISGLGAIRGMTAFGAYINEASLANEEVFNEIRHRCSKHGARVVCDTNPDVPTHWLKTKFIDNPNHSPNIISNHFILDDNTFADPDFIAKTKHDEPRGMFYDRAVLGLWVSGDGLVYQDFDKDKNTMSQAEFEQRTKDQNLIYYCGVDWGFEHKGVIVVLCDDEQGNTYLIEEHTAQHKNIQYWVDVAKGIQSRYGFQVPFYVDYARPDDYNEFKDANINAIYCHKDRLANVEKVATDVKTRHFFAINEVVEAKNSKFFDELYQYIWDEKTGLPVKQNDDVMDAWQYAYCTRQYLLHKNDQPNVGQQTQLLEDQGLIDPEDPTGFAF